MTPDGKCAVWSQIVDGSVLVYTFGRWELMLADFEDSGGAPRFINHKNITPTGMHWNEPGNFSPDNADRSASKVLSIKTEFMLMNKDGSGLVQLTHFKEPGYPESSEGIAANNEWSRDGRSANLRQLFFTDYRYWDVVFEGPCGNSARPAQK